MSKVLLLKRKFRYFDLIRQIGISDFKVKYQNSMLGYFWSLGRPLLLFLVLYTVFSHFLKFGGRIPNFPVFLLSGVVFWNYFAESTLTSMRSIVGKGMLLRKVYFPREVIILASSVTTTLTFLLNLIVVFAFLYFTNVSIGWDTFLLVPIIIEFYILVVAISLILSTLFVKFRDVGHLWDVGIQAMFYATPIFYSPILVPERLQPFLMLNPVAHVIQQARSVLLEGDIVTSADVLPGFLWLVPYVTIALLFVVGAWYFRKKSSSFAEDV